MGGFRQPLSVGEISFGSCSRFSWQPFYREQSFQPHLLWRRQMNLQKTYPSLLTRDLAAAEGWYTKLLGRGPDRRPMDTLLHWELFEQGGLMVSSSEEIASQGIIFLYVADLPAERRRLESQGIALGDDIEGDYSTLAQVHDPDGNIVTLATPPARPFPPA
jgi:catechol 2,3-dioxygenase-like lactoylglutathione lyase family enzyme